MSEDLLSELWETVLRILERRAHTRSELRRKLRQRSYEADAIDAAVAKAERLYLLGDEAELAEQYAASLASRDRATPAWVRSKLLSRGFASEHADLAVKSAFEEWRPSDAARRLLEKEQDLDRGVRRLLRRGFPADDVWAAAHVLRRERRGEDD